MIPAADAWGPFRPDLDPAEHTARLRCLRAVVHLSVGPRGADLAGLLRLAETAPTVLPAVIAPLARLAALDRRHVLASYAALNRPTV